MKREAVGHTKMKRLCRRLDIPVYQGVGILESLWHLTARESPRGDIGKLSDEDIALAIDYRGGEANLIEALVLSGWIDRDPFDRLVIHDWHHHADDAVHMRLARSRQHFCGGHAPKLTRLAGEERRTAHEYYNSCARTGASSAPPEPVPVPVPEPEPLLEPEPDTHTTPSVKSSPQVEALNGVRLSNSDFHRNSLFEKVNVCWPEHRRNKADRATWMKLVDTDNEAQVVACIGRYLASDEVARGVVFTFYKFLKEQNAKNWITNWPAPVGKQQPDDPWERAAAGEVIQ